MTRAPLPVAFLSALFLHALGLTIGSLVWQAPRVAVPPPPPAAEVMVVTPVSEPTPSREPTPLPAQGHAPEPVVLPSEVPITPPRVEPKPPPPRPEPPAKRRSASRPLRKAPPLTQAPEGSPGPAAVGTADREKANPGPGLSFPDDHPEGAAGNVLGPSPEVKHDAPLHAVEGGEAGAGQLFDRGDVPVVPGTGDGGGGGAGRAGLGLSAAGSGMRVGGIRPGAGGDRSGGLGGFSPPSGGYQIKPRYPEEARRRGVEGTVLLKVRVTERGGIEVVQVEHSAGHAALDQAAMEAIQRWQFSPARQGNRPVATWVLIPVTFKLE